MENAEELGRHLEKQVPFLRHMLHSLKQDCGQYTKISAICDIIERRTKANISYATLQKCDRVIQLLKNVGARKGRIAKQEPPAKREIKEESGDSATCPAKETKPMIRPDDSFDAKTASEKIASIKTHFEPIDSPDDGIQSPDDEFQIMSPDDEIKSPDGADASTERYENERPSIYSVVAESIKRASPVALPPTSEASPPAFFPPPPVVPVVDTSKPPISAADLEVLLLEDAQTTEVKKVKVENAAEKEVNIVQKSKVSLVPTPFHKKVRKDDRDDKTKRRGEPEKSGGKDSAKGERNATSNKHKSGRNDKDSSVKHSRSSKDSKDKDSKGSKGAKEKEEKESKESAKTKSCKTVVESGSIFGSILSGLDEKLIPDKARRDSKDGEAARCDSAGASSASTSKSVHSKEKSHDKDRDRAKDRDKHSCKHNMDILEKKIETTERDLAAALKKEGLSGSEQADIKKRFGDRIRRYRRELETVRRHDRRTSHEGRRESQSDKGAKSGQEKGDKEKGKDKDKEKGKDKDKEKGKDKDKEKSKSIEKEKERERGKAKEKSKERDKEKPKEKTKSVTNVKDKEKEASKVDGKEKVPEKEMIGGSSNVLEKAKETSDKTESVEMLAQKETETTDVPVAKETCDNAVEEKPRLSEGVKKILGPGVKIKKKVEAKSTTADEKAVKPMEPPPLPLGFQDFDPFAKDANALRSPLHEVGNDHLQDQVGAVKKGTCETTAKEEVPAKPQLPAGVKKILGPGVIIRKKVEDKSAPVSTVTAEEKLAKPMEPPPLPLGFQDFNPFANESAEINRLYGVKKRENPPPAPTARDANPLRSPLHEVGNDHLHEPAVPNRDPREFRDVRDPRVPMDPRAYRDPRDPREYRGDPREMCDRRDPREFRRMESGFHPPPSPREFPPDAYGPRHHLMQHRLSRPQSNLLQGRWEPPPGAERREDAQWGMGNRFPPPPPPPLLNQQAMNNPGFHPFEPIGNEYDLSKMQPVDFYSPVKQQNNTPQNYRQWRELRQRDEHRKRLIEEAKEAEKKKEEAKKKKEEEEEEAKKKREEEAARKREEDEEAKKKEEQREDAKIEEEEVSAEAKTLSNDQKETDADEKSKDKVNNDDGQEDSPEVGDITKSKKRGRPKKPIVLLSSDSEDDKPLKRKAVIEVPEPTAAKTDVADESKEEMDAPGSIKEPDNEVDRDSLLKMLSQAKKATAADGGTYVPAKILEMMESFLQKEAAAASKSASQSTSTPNQEAKEEEEEEAEEKIVVAAPAEEEVKTEHPVDIPSEAAKDTNKNAEKVPSVDTDVVDEVKDEADVVTEEGGQTKKTDEGEKAKEEQAKPDPEWQIGRRLRRRTKSINYNEVRISDTEDSPKRKKKLIEEVENSSPSPVPIKAKPPSKEEKDVSSPSPTPAKTKPVRGKAASKKVEEDETLSTTIPDSGSTADDSTEDEEEYKATIKNPDSLAVTPPKTRGRKKKPNIERIIDGIADGSIPLDYKFEEVAEHERAAEARTLDLIIQGELEEMFRREDDEFSSFLEVSRSADAPIAEKEVEAQERKEEKKEKSKRKSELDQLHLDIKSTLGEGIMGSCRRGLNTGSSSRASSPGSVKSSTSLRDELKDVKITPAVDEILKQGKTLRVILEKLPENREVCVSPSPLVTRHKIGPKSRMNRSGSKTPQPDGENKGAESIGVKRISSEAEPDSENKNKKMKMAEELNFDKEYYLKFERNYVNSCRLCTFSGTQIIVHYIGEHPEAGVLISRLAPDATLDACQESILNDYSGMEATMTESKKPLKYDFRCRFCFHDLQKELVATFYDHVSSHTGELRYHCTECPYKHHVKSNVKNHIQFAHNLTKEPHAEDIPKFCDKLFGYVCSECNYLQLKKETVAEHMKTYHGKDAFLYTINMSLPILQRTMKANKDLGFEGGVDVPGVRRLRSRQKKPEEKKDDLDKTPPEKTPEKIEKVEKAKPLEKVGERKSESSKSIMDKLMEKTEDFALPSELLPSGAKPPPSSAFVCDDWDDLLKADISDTVPDAVITAPKRNSSFLDALKKRLDEQEKTPAAYLSPPIDKEVMYSSEIGPDSDDDAQTVQIKKENDALPEKQLKISMRKQLGQLKAKPPNSQLRKLHSVGIIDAMIDKKGGITYICRKNACIFQTTDPRVHEVHCNYTHSNSLEQMDCSFCPARNITLPMVEVFAHLFDHVESYQASTLELPLASIKQEQEDSTEQVETEDVIEIEDDNIPCSEPPTAVPTPVSVPKLPFMISKVESLANKEPPPLATLSLSKVPTLDAAKDDKVDAKIDLKPKIKVSAEKVEKCLKQQPNTAICKIVPMHRMELKMDRKSEAVMTAWLKEGLLALFKCPSFNCQFFTQSEDAFEEHLKEHAFGEAFLPCLYCNFKMRQEFIKIHIMMRHARCSFGCGHCLYRARKSEYVVVHHEVCHEGKALRVKEFDLSNFHNRYRPPFLPPIKNILKPYICGCGKKYYLMKVCQNHHLTCSMAGQDNYDQMFAFNCRYCPDGGAHTYFEVFRHIALEHPFHDVAIVCRQKDEAVQKTAGTNILNQLVIRDDTNLSEVLPTIPITGPLHTSTPIKPSPVAIKAIATSGSGPTTINAIIPVSLTSSLSTSTVNPLIPVCAVPAGPKSQIMTIAGGVNSGPRLFLVLDDIKKTSGIVTPSTSAVAKVVQASMAPISSIVASASSVTSVSSASTSTTMSGVPGAPVVASKPAVPAEPPSILKGPLSAAIIAPSDEGPKNDLYKCYNCRQVSENSVQFAKHLGSCIVDGSSKPYICFYCSRNYRHANTLVEHMRVHGVKNLSCGLCGHKEARLNCLKKHVKDVHKLNNIVLQPVNPDKSNIDVDNFIGKPVLTAPLDPGVLVPDADDDGTAFGPADIDNVPITPIFKFMATCKNCDFSTKVRSNFLRHLQLHTSGKFDSKLHVGEAVNPVPCLEKNELMFDKMTNLAASSFEGRMGPKSTTSGATSTSTATKTTPPEEKADVKDAIPMYVPEVRRYVCGATGCNYLCLEEQNLRHHLQALHDNEQVFQCIHCQVEIVSKDGKTSFIDIDAIMEHFRLHDGTLFKCAHCDYLHSKASRVEKHSAEKHADKPAKPLAIRQEVESVEEPPDVGKSAKKRPWKCCICACRKATEDGIKLHVKEKHTMDAQYKCTHCQFKDDVSTGFPWHFQTCHPKLSPDIIVAYFRDDKEESGEQVGGRFDTTPLWVKNRDAVKHIRGILLDEEASTARKGAKSATKMSPVKVLPKPAGVKRRKSVKPADSNVQKVQKISKGNEEEIVLIVDPEPTPTPTKVPKISDVVASMTKDSKMKSLDGVIEINDDDLTLSEIETMSIEEILKPKFFATYGPTLGVPSGLTYVCPYCSLNFTADEEFRDHLYQELKYNRFVCPICKEETTTLARMSEHYTEAHVVLCAEDAITTLPMNANCELWIKKVFRLQDRVIEHRKKSSQVVPIKPNVKLLYKCSHCGHHTHNKLDAVAHCRAAHGNLPVKFVNPLNTSPS